MFEVFGTRDLGDRLFANRSLQQLGIIENGLHTLASRCQLSFGGGQSRLEFQRMKRLPEHVVRARIERCDQVVGLVLDRHHHDVQVVRLTVLPHEATGRDTVHRRHLPIEDGERRVGFGH